MVKDFFLGIETSSVATGLALIKGEDLFYEVRCLTGSKHNETIYQLLSDSLNFVGIEVKDLSGIGVSIGPGMFTSLRVGLALVKGLALPFQIPVKGINTLDALANSVPNFTRTNNLVVAVIDARKEEVFAAIYHGKTRISEYLIVKPKELVNQISDTQRMKKLEEIEFICFIGNGLKKYRSSFEQSFPKGFDSVILEAPLPSTIAFLAKNRILAGDISEIASLQPFYLRPTDAELKRHKVESNILI
jgi:tRNA threonylcarbamoyladenosine biosynthesis protein TsaB